MRKVKIKRIDTEIPLPCYETQGSVGFDILARKKTIIPAQSIGLIPGNIIVQIPKGYMLIVASRSSTPKKKGLMMPHGIGIIDYDYSGEKDEILIQVYNFTDHDVPVERGEKIAQGLFVAVDRFSWQEISEVKKRSRGGFGSTDQKKGKLITIYGINNIGKSTQTDLLVKKLCEHGYKALSLKYPLYNLQPTGSKLNRILRSKNGQAIDEKELQTLFWQNRKDYETTLRQLLADGNIVIAEDYTGTGIAWGMAKGLRRSWLENLNKNLLIEDFAFLLRGKRNLKAQEQHHIHENNHGLIKKVDHILFQLSKNYGWKIIQAQANIDATSRLLWKEIKKILK